MPNTLKSIPELVIELGLGVCGKFQIANELDPNKSSLFEIHNQLSSLTFERRLFVQERLVICSVSFSFKILCIKHQLCHVTDNHVLIVDI